MLNQSKKSTKQATKKSSRAAALLRTLEDTCIDSDSDLLQPGFFSGDEDLYMDLRLELSPEESVSSSRPGVNVGDLETSGVEEDSACQATPCIISEYKSELLE